MMFSSICIYMYLCVHVHVCIVCMNHFYGMVGVETVQVVGCEATGLVYRMRPLGVHLSLKSWTLWSTREGGERIVINYQPLSDTWGFYFLSTSTKHHIMFITCSSCGY